MENIEKTVNALCAVALAKDEKQRTAALGRLRKCIGEIPCTKPDPESIIRELLMELGAPDRLSGHAYTIEAVHLIIQDRSFLHDMMKRLYPTVAAKFNTNDGRVERCIRHLIETAWNRTDYTTSYRYFGNTVDPNRAKPTNGEFLSRLASIVQQRMT